MQFDYPTLCDIGKPKDASISHLIGTLVFFKKPKFCGLIKTHNFYKKNFQIEKVFIKVYLFTKQVIHFCIYPPQISHGGAIK